MNAMQPPSYDIDSILTPLSVLNEHQQTQMANMAATQSDLLQQLAAMHEEFAALTAHQRNPAAPVMTPAPTALPTPIRKNPKNHKTIGYYCSSHGYKARGAHTSAICTNPNPGHQVGATATDTMGGSIQGKPVPEAPA